MDYNQNEAACKHLQAACEHLNKQYELTIARVDSIQKYIAYNIPC